MIHNVLVAVDGSENSQRALDFALDLVVATCTCRRLGRCMAGAAETPRDRGGPIAGKHGKDVKGLIRVHEFFKMEQVILCEADHQESVRFHEEILSKAVAHAKEIKPNVVVSSKLREGDPALEIVA